MKKLLALTIVALFVLLTACSGQKPAQPEQTDAPAASDDENQAETTAADAAPAEDLVTIDGMTITVKDDGTGTTTDESGVKKTPLFTNRNVGFEMECGPMIFKINAVQLSTFVSSDESINSFLDIDADTEVTLITLEVTAENTSDEDINFYPDQAQLVTDQKEQITSEMFLNDDVGGEFLGKVEKTGLIYFVAKKSPADAINTVTLRINAPHNSDFESLGEHIAVTINFAR